MITFLRFMRDETAATAVEYGLIAGLTSVVIIGGIAGIGTKLNSKFSKISSALT